MPSRVLEKITRRLHLTRDPEPRKILNISLDLWLALIVAIALIGFGFFLGWDTNKIVTPLPPPGFHYLAELHNPLSFMANWDAVDYLEIAKHGYTNLFWVNWFPVYPLAINAVNHVIPSALDSALLIAWLSLVGAIYFYIKIVRRLFSVTDEFEPLRALVFFVLFPTAVFLIAPFSESLYALLALGAIYLALQKRWLGAAILALVCSATHITGIFIVVLVGLILLEEKVRWLYVILSLIIGSLGLASYMAYLEVKYHDPLAFLKSQTVYHHWTHFGFLNLLTTMSLSNLIYTVLIVIAAGYWWLRRKSFAVYTLLFLAIPLVGRQWGGFSRYVLMAFPVQLMAYAYLRDRTWRYQGVLVMLGVAWTYFLLHYAGGYIGS